MKLSKYIVTYKSGKVKDFFARTISFAAVKATEDAIEHEEDYHIESIRDPFGSLYEAEVNVFLKLIK